MAKKTNKKPPIEPLADRVLVRPLSDEELGSTSAAGIIIPETVSRDKADRGEVLAVGPGKRDEDGERVPLDVKVGDRVIFQWGDKVEWEGEDYYIVREDNILARFGE
ncbi:MAG: 10 kDa chaperonin [Candidatus Parcubacteria bacterium]|nr:MAG: 10 kDa chaperonin [Candidatus Parcubacteria bacterium]